MWAVTDFEGDPSDHAQEGWFTDSLEHDYSGRSIGLEFDVDLDEIEDEQSVVYIVREMCMNAAALRKRHAEVNERHLNQEEKEMFRAAKRAERSQWIGNDVVELISRHGVDPRRVISSRWVLTWKRVEETPNSPVKPKARLVIRGFRPRFGAVYYSFPDVNPSRTTCYPQHSLSLPMACIYTGCKDSLPSG